MFNRKFALPQGKSGETNNAVISDVGIGWSRALE